MHPNDFSILLADWQRRLFEIDPKTEQWFVGCTDDEINQMMTAQQVTQLPEVYRQFLLRMGKGESGIFHDHIDETYPALLDLKAEALFYLENEAQLIPVNANSRYTLPADAFVFSGRLSEQFYYFLMDNLGEDADVFYLGPNETDKHPKQLSIFLLKLCEDRLRLLSQVKGQPMSRTALFAGLVFDEKNNNVENINIGDEAFYIVDDDGFKRHVPAADIDKVVLQDLRDQTLANRDAVTQGAMQMMGAEDLFTKAMIDSSLNNIDSHFAKLMDTGLPEQARQWLGMLGFKIIVNYHGEVIRMESPGIASDEGE